MEELSEIGREIMLASYWAHHSADKELALIYPVTNKKRKLIEAEMNAISERLNYKSNN